VFPTIPCVLILYRPLLVVHGRSKRRVSNLVGFYA
jgi:hypothetical protein